MELLRTRLQEKETLGSSKNEDKEKKMKAITHFRTFKKQTNKQKTYKGNGTIVY